MDIKQYLQSGKRLIFDGAMGTMLQRKGLPAGMIPEEVNFLHPEWLIDIHREYLAAGAHVITTNTFGANSHKLATTGHTVAETVKAALDIAINARSERDDVFIAQDLGPIGQLMLPSGTLTFEEAYELYKEQVIAGEERADFFLLETTSDLYELKAAVLAVKENSKLPIICTMTFEKNMRTFNGTSIESLAVMAEALGLLAVGVNCSYGPSELLPIMERLCACSRLPLMIRLMPVFLTPKPVLTPSPLRNTAKIW